MISPAQASIIAILFLSTVFFAAFFIEMKNSDRILKMPIILALLMGIYATAWTFYGCIGLATKNTYTWLAFYIGPSVALMVFFPFISKIRSVCQRNNLRTFGDYADFTFGGTGHAGAVITILACVGIIPYTALQIKAVSQSFVELTGSHGSLFYPAIMTVIFAGIFTIFFAHRSLSGKEGEKGFVFAIVLFSILKLSVLLFLAIWSIFAVFGTPTVFINDFNTLHSKPSSGMNAENFTVIMVLSMSAIVFLPRQFTVLVMTKLKTDGFRKAVFWFVLYMFLVSFTIPIIATAGFHLGIPLTKADSYTLLVPLVKNSNSLAMIVFLGGLSAAFAMLIVSTVTLSVMVSNNLVFPLVISGKSKKGHRYLLSSRWFAAVLILTGGLLFDQLLGNSHVLVKMGIISFAAVIQFSPGVIFTTITGRKQPIIVISGLLIGFLVWTWTMLVPAIIRSGWLSSDILISGPFGMSIFKPENLFGTSLEPLTNFLFWSLFLNGGVIIILSKIVPEQITQDYNNSEELLSFARNVQNLSVKEKTEKIRTVLKTQFEEKELTEIIHYTLANSGTEKKEFISSKKWFELIKEVQKQISLRVGNAVSQKIAPMKYFLSLEEKEELKILYRELVLRMADNPEEMFRKINYLEEKEEILKKNSELMETKIKELNDEVATRQKIEAKLNESTSRFYNLTELLPQVVFEIDENGKFLFLNKHGRKIFNYETDDSYTSGNIFDLIELNTISFQTIDFDEEIITYEQFPVTIDQQNTSLKGLMYCARMETGKGFRGIIVDITQIEEYRVQLEILNKNLEAKVSERTEQLEKLLEDLTSTQNRLIEKEKMAALGDLVAGVAHEINTPIGVSITAITFLSGLEASFSSLLESGKIRKSEIQDFINEIRETVEILITNLENAARLINGFKKIAVDQSISDERKFNLSEYVDSIVISLRPQFKKAGHNVLNKVDKNIFIIADAGAIYQILSNLIMNAIIHGFVNKNNGTVEILTFVENSELTIFIKDDGAGIPKEIHRKIFDPFFTTRRGEGGSGLGLAIVYNLITGKLKGTLDFSCPPEGGTEFRILFKPKMEYSGVLNYE